MWVLGGVGVDEEGEEEGDDGGCFSCDFGVVVCFEEFGHVFSVVFEESCHECVVFVVLDVGEARNEAEDVVDEV